MITETQRHGDYLFQEGMTPCFMKRVTEKIGGAPLKHIALGQFA
jgi:hypothetical protein